MHRAITLIELLITLTVMIVAIYFISPIIFHLPDPIIIQNEVDQIRAFIYQIQTKARYHKQNYSITVNQNQSDNRWCIVAIAKKSTKQTACDCLNIKNCEIQDGYFSYQPFSQKIKLKSNSLYPKVFFNIDGRTGQLGEKCLGLRLNNISEVLQFNSDGVINVAQKNKRTQCR